MHQMKLLIAVDVVSFAKTPNKLCSKNKEYCFQWFKVVKCLNVYSTMSITRIEIFATYFFITWLPLPLHCNVLMCECWCKCERCQTRKLSKTISSYERISVRWGLLVLYVHLSKCERPRCKTFQVLFLKNDY